MGISLSDASCKDDEAEENSADLAQQIEVLAEGQKGDATRYILASLSRYDWSVKSVIYSSNSVTVKESPNVYLSGKIIDHADQFPVLNEAKAIELAKANKDNGNKYRANGNYFKYGLHKWKKLKSLNGVIFIDASKYGHHHYKTIHLANVHTDSDKESVLIVKGNLKLTGKTSFKGLIVALDGSRVEVKGNAAVEGAIITNNKKTIVQGSSSVIYMENYIMNELVLSLLDNIEHTTLTSWKEYYPAS